MADIETTSGERRPFQPKGEIPQWEMVYQLIHPLAVGETIDYDTLEQQLGFDVRSARAPIYKAIKELENNELRTMEVVVGVGYRVVEPWEHERLARRHHRKGRKQLGQALNKLRSANRSKMSPEEARRFDIMEVTVARHEDVLRRLDGKVARLDAAIQQSRDEYRASNDEIAQRFQKVEDALRRRGITLDDE